ncbi:MAG: broad specificity phosphatase PhoE [Oleiphilaceae bacterium]|jgi:broad specificity phosphatase PhoE
MSTETIIDLIRHGEPVGGQRLRGAQDDPLSELGWQQMRASVGDFSPWTKLLTSPLSRCHAFTQELSTKLKLELDINKEFREIHFGEWEGLRIKDLMKQEPKALRNYWQDPDNNAPKGSERLTDFTQRINVAWDELIINNQGEHTLLVCHGGVIRAILSRVLGMPKENLWNFDVPYANVSRIVYHHFPDGGQTAQLKFHQAAFS